MDRQRDRHRNTDRLTDRHKQTRDRDRQTDRQADRFDGHIKMSFGNKELTLRLTEATNQNSNELEFQRYKSTNRPSASVASMTYFSSPLFITNPSTFLPLTLSAFTSLTPNHRTQYSVLTSASSASVKIFSRQMLATPSVASATK